ncbi:MAG: hypothetical protein KBA70_08525, partial [Aquabacterium sp.]|nr:hypothetical protein [Aquabacterium sp.]
MLSLPDRHLGGASRAGELVCRQSWASQWESSVLVYVLLGVLVLILLFWWFRASRRPAVPPELEAGAQTEPQQTLPMEPEAPLTEPQTLPEPEPE